MYISELKIQGFKSFAKKEVLHFGEGITSIVGPNGCGKTNIVDAIRWVLGEQKHSVLRSGKMEDVIFNGSEGLKPLSVSEVSLVVHNDQGQLPVEYTDVEIGRRIYRNGESEYFLNRIPCRLKDIQNLFIDTGMGADAYSVIELNMIEQILSESADDRKRMFEEAAGINKYKTQRRSTLRKFEATKLDLERIHDIISEVETKVQALNLQLKRYKRHTRLTEKLQEKEITLANTRILKCDELAEPLHAKIKKFTHLKESQTTEEGIHEKELGRLQVIYQEQLQELENIRSKLNVLEEEREQQRHNILVWTEQARSATATINRLNLEKDNNRSKRSQLVNHVKDFDEEISLLEPRIDEKHAIYKAKKEEYVIAENAYKKAQSELEHIQSRRWEEQRKVSDQQSLIDRTKSLIEGKTEQIKRFETKLNDLESNQAGHSREQEALEEKKTRIQADLKDRKSAMVTLENRLSGLQEKRHKLTLKHHSTLTQVESLESQLQFYRELVMTKEGYPDGVRYVLDHPDDFPGILGTIADLFEVEETYRLVLDSGLGELAHCLIADNRKTALAALEQVQHEKAGKLTLIPLKEISSIATKLKPTPRNKQVIGRASDLVVTDKSLKPLANFLIGNLLVVEDLKTAWQDMALKGWDLVDLKGAFSGVNYLLKNRQESKHGSVIGRQKKIEALDKEIDKMVVQTQSIKEELDSMDINIASTEQDIESLSSQVGALLDEQSGVETEIIRNHYRQSQSLETIQDTTHELAAARKTLHQLTNSLDALMPKMQEGETLLANLNEKLQHANKAVESAQQERDTITKQVQEIRIDLLNIENDRDNLQFQKRTAEETIKELDNRQSEIDTEVQSLEQDKNSLQEQITEGEKNLIRVKGKIQHQRSVLELKQQAHSATYQEIEELQAQIRSEQRNREAILEELKQCELKVTEYNQQIELIKERIQDRYGIEINIPKHPAEAKQLRRSTEEIDDLELEIQRLERSIENIGPINMAVQAEYESESDRLAMLNEQKDDLIAAEENLRETIQKIDRVARKQFKDTFNRIKTNFEKLFVVFFEGGQATLTLAGDPDPLEADIAIHAQPPGKRNQSLRMLSAGEKALTAIALLFAIYQVKPSPYCILDEVDAPLDDMNIRKFTRVLKKFSDETQFIVVTHNKLTMEAANYLYGVTMEQKGISKLVSVKFDN